MPNASSQTHSPAMHTPPLSTLPTSLQALLPDARLVGQGTLRFFGLLVYDVYVWSRERMSPDAYTKQPFAMDFVYARKLEGIAIAERSIAEMRRIGSFDDAQAQQWLATLKQAFPDVSAQERLQGVNDGRGGVRFFHNGSPTAQLEDETFARLFFGIWLAPQTSAPALRQALLGLSG